MATTTRSKAKPETLRAWQSFVADTPTGPIVMKVGTVVPATHPAVVAAPRNFVSIDVPFDEVPSVFDGVVADGEAKAAANVAKVVAPRIAPTTTIAELAICTVAVLSSSAGPCTLGRIVMADDPLVHAAPSAFEALTTTL